MCLLAFLLLSILAFQLVSQLRHRSAGCEFCDPSASEARVGLQISTQGVPLLAARNCDSSRFMIAREYSSIGSVSSSSSSSSSSVSMLISSSFFSSSLLISYRH